MTPIVDCHAHIFPDDLAARALQRLSANSGETAWTDGTAAGLAASMRSAGIARSVILPIATKPQQTPKINAWAIALNRPPFAALGALHPDYPDNAGEIRRLRAAGIRGVKLHPDYQDFFVDDRRLFPLYQALANAGLAVFFHAGADLGLAPPYHCPPERLARVLESFPGLIVIAAHFGGFQMWDDVARHLIGRRVYLDTSYTLPFLPVARWLPLARRHGLERVLFGTDSPWKDQAAELDSLRAAGLTPDELAAVLGGNAARLLDRA